MPVKKLVGVFTALAIALMTAVISIPSAAASSTDAQFASRLYVLINDYRAQHALQPLRWNDSMSATAQSWTQQSADQANVQGAGVFQHSPGSYAFPENIVWNMSADQAFSWWVNSPAHRGNMLRATDTDIGLGAVQLTAGPNRGAYLATAQFGRSALSPEQEAARAAEEARIAAEAQAAAEKAAADAAAQAAADAAAQAAADKAAADAAAKAAADKAAADKAAADQAAADAAAQAAADKAAADKAAADKAAADAGKTPGSDTAVPAPESNQTQDQAAEEKAAEEAAAEKAAAEEKAAAQKAAEEKAAAEKAAEAAAAQKAAEEEAAAEKAAEAAAAQAAEETAANIAAEQAAELALAQETANQTAAADAAEKAAAEKAAAEEAAAAQAAAEKAAAEKAAAETAAREAAEQKARVAAATALEQVTLGNEAFLTASTRGTAAAVAAGSQLRISGLETAGTYEVVLPSAGVNLGAVTADAGGSLAVGVPAVLGAGEHKVALFRNGVLSGWTTFTVEQAVTVLAAAPVPAAADGTAELAATGLNAAQLSIGGIGALMALTGAAALVALQRQRSTSTR